MPGARPITFLTDFGLEDEFVGVCKLVIDGISPDSRVIDITHAIEPGDVRGGAIRLAEAIGYSPPAVHLAVVDPGVGGDRRAVAVAASDRFLVGPDNGLLSLAIERLGGAGEAVEISRSRAGLEPAARTFHGRDIFSPVAAHLASGRRLAELGDPIDPAGMVEVRLPEPVIRPGRIEATVLTVDRFGNLALNLRASDLGEPPARATLEPGACGEAEEVAFGAAFGDAAEGEPLLYPDSSGRIALALNRGSAARHFGLGPGSVLGIVL